ncbi:MAG: DUF362 domain-containing protein [Candidatus Woesearchaeota archaeon]
MSKVYFKKVTNKTSVKEVQHITQQLLDRIIKEEDIKLEKDIPLKVHFGEKGNTTFIKPENYDGIIDYLEKKDIKSCFMETTVLYGGERAKKDTHIKIAKEHGFTRLPIIIADGEQGEDVANVKVDFKNLKSCMIGAEFLKYKQLIVISHFKGHMIAGFGGAIKQLAMGHAAKGGKLAMHMDVKPRIIDRKCKRCHACQKVCNVDAITIGEKSFIDHDKCIGCGACFATCPYKAISIFCVTGMLHAIGICNNFKEKLAEYAFAAQKGKHNIYINFAMSITSGCDCMGKKMTPLMDDIGIFISTDPVAIDMACYDMVKDNGKKFRGADILPYAEKIGLGSQEYDLIDI